MRANFPLNGLKVLDLTSVVAGPLATQLLVEQGATVWKIESETGDRARGLGSVHESGIGSSFQALNDGKVSIPLSLGIPQDREKFECLLRQADVFVHNLKPGALKRLGWDPEDLRARYPELIVAQLSGYGQSGPCSGQRAYDPVVQAEAGMAFAFGGIRNLPPQWIADKIAGLFLSQAICSALVARARTGYGSIVDISMLEAAVAFVWPDVLADLTFSSGASKAPDIATVYEPWPTADGDIVVIMLSQSEFEGWAKAIEVPDVITDPDFLTMEARFHNWARLRQICAPKVFTFGSEELLQRLEEYNVPAGRVRMGRQVLDHPQLVADDFLTTVTHPKCGPMLRSRPVARFDGHRRAPGIANALGEADLTEITMAQPLHAGGNRVDQQDP